jgi:ABC-type Fe3+ transport system substrate-binding protein
MPDTDEGCVISDRHSTKPRKIVPLIGSSIYPAEGVPFVNYPMLLLANSPNQKAGELLANWYVSKRGQAALVRVRGASSARADVPPVKGTPSADKLKLWNPGSQEIIDNFQAFYGKVDSIMTRR